MLLDAKLIVRVHLGCGPSRLFALLFHYGYDLILGNECLGSFTPTTEYSELLKFMLFVLDYFCDEFFSQRLFSTDALSISFSGLITVVLIS